MLLHSDDDDADDDFDLMPERCVDDDVLCLVADALLERAKDSDGVLMSHGVMRLVVLSWKENIFEERKLSPILAICFKHLWEKDNRCSSPWPHSRF